MRSVIVICTSKGDQEYIRRRLIETIRKMKDLNVKEVDTLDNKPTEHKLVVDVDEAFRCEFFTPKDKGMSPKNFGQNKRRKNK